MGRLRDLLRSLARRPFLLFGLLLLVPASGFALLGWRGVLRERDLEAQRARAAARDVVERRLEALAGGLRELRAREEERPYFAYQTQYSPEQTAFGNVDFQPSPLTRAPDDERILGWFQWERGSRGPFERPEVFGPGAEGWTEALLAGYGGALRERLAAAPGSVEGRLGREVEHPLRVVVANEERGKLIEEVQILQQIEAQSAEEAPAPAATPYLESFYARISEEPVPVRYGPFRYLARGAEAQGPPLVAWRLVWIPAVLTDRREVDRDRWLLQGYALDPGLALPAAWEAVGSVRLVRRDAAADLASRAEGSHHASLVDLLDAERLGEEADPTLALLALPDPDALEAAWRVSRGRFLWVAAGLVVVVGIGFLVLTRGVRREVALARRKEDFVAAVTHELKTPLTGIRMYADLLHEGWVRDAQSATRYAQRIIEESDRLGHLVDQVLDLAALERGVTRLRAQRGDFAAAVGDAVRLVEARARQAGVDLSQEAEPGLLPVRFDPRLLRPLVLNLLDNAIKYSEHASHKEVRVRVFREGDRVVLQVADRGVGIDPRVQRHLFRPFQRGGDEMTRSAPGVGIGLALVKRYAEAHGARIDLESAPGEGTTVTVRFPGPA